MVDDLTLKVGSRSISGWTTIRVTRGIERLPSDFAIGLTELSPQDANSVVINPGAACQVFLDKDLVVTGYIDHYLPGITPTGHAIRAMGRGKCQDLVDCSAEWAGNQISNSTALGIAEKLAAPYGIAVTALDPVGKVVDTYKFMWGATAYSVLELACRYSALLAYDGPDGNLILSRVGTGKAASGFTQGVNVQEAWGQNSIDQRYQDYVLRTLSMSFLNDLGGYNGDIMETFHDLGVTRHRLKYLIAENGGNPKEFVLRRAMWEAARRYGRGHRLHVTTDSWRDKDGKLWTPNTLAPIDIPATKIVGKNWVIGEVTYIKDEKGTRADLILMPPEAFEPEPKLLLNPLNDIYPKGSGVAQ